jgi:hydrogenase maturation factor HypF (carbamoyltransferase family)
MSHDHSALIAQFTVTLTQQRYNPEVVHNSCRNADYFLRYLAEREIAVEAATPAEVSNYLRGAVRWFRKRHGYSPHPNGSPFREQQSRRCCGACRNGGHLSL